MCIRDRGEAKQHGTQHYRRRTTVTAVHGWKRGSYSTRTSTARNDVTRPLGLWKTTVNTRGERTRGDRTSQGATRQHLVNNRRTPRESKEHEKSKENPIALSRFIRVPGRVGVAQNSCVNVSLVVSLQAPRSSASGRYFGVVVVV